MEKIKDENKHECELSNIHLAKYMNNSWFGFMIPLKTLETIKLHSITMIGNYPKNPPNVFYSENWNDTKKKEVWIELHPIKFTQEKLEGMNQNIIEIFFQDLIFKRHLNIFILIIDTSIFFLHPHNIQKMEDQYKQRNEHIEVMKGRAMKVDFEILSHIDYYFIGSIKTSIYCNIYQILNKMDKSRDIFIHFE